MNKNPDDDNDKVGYGRPPKHSQYKPGETGNPRGRPKGSRNLSTDVKHTLKKAVTFTEDGKRKKTSTQLATLLKLREKALRGDSRALDRMVELATRYNDEPAVGPADTPLSINNKEVIADFLARQVPMGPPPASPAVKRTKAAAASPKRVIKRK